MRLFATLLLIVAGLAVTAQAQPSDTRLYVPLVRVPGPTETPIGPTATVAPTVTPTATTTPIATTIPILTLINGDFELDTGWTFDGAFIADNAIGARSGTRYALLAGDRTDQERMSQRVTISSAAPVLSFWHRAGSDWFSCELTIGYIWVDPRPDDTTFSRVIVDSVYDFCQDRRHGYEQLTIDLSAYSGQTVEIEFELDITGGVFSSWGIDDVSFASAAP